MDKKAEAKLAKQIQTAEEKLDNFKRRNYRKINKCNETIKKCQETIKEYNSQVKKLLKIIKDLKLSSDKYCPYCLEEDCDMGEDCDAN